MSPQAANRLQLTSSVVIVRSLRTGWTVASRVHAMRMSLSLCLVGICISGPGCSLFVNATKNVVGETSQCLEGYAERNRNSQLAKEAWTAVGQAGLDASYSEDYNEGFKAGYADYLEAGGTG